VIYVYYYAGLTIFNLLFVGAGNLWSIFAALYSIFFLGMYIVLDYLGIDGFGGVNEEVKESIRKSKQKKF